MHVTGKYSLGFWFILFLATLSFSTPQILKAAGGPVRLAPIAGQIPKDANEAFPVTSVGATSTICTGFCFCNGTCPSGGCDATGSGIAQSGHFPSPPFGVYGFRIQPYAYGFIDCNAGTPVQLPATVGIGQQIVFTLSFSPSRPGTFNDYFDLTDFRFNLSGSTPRGSASLVPYQPSGWSAPIVVSNTQGTQVDSSAITSTEPLYISWAVLNAGDLSTFDTFYIDLYLDGGFLQRWQHPDSLPPNYYTYVKDYQISPLTPGAHALELIPDSTNILGPSHSYTKTFTVGQSTPPPPSKPTTSTSWYVHSTGKYKKDSALYAWANQVGQQAGQLNNSSGGANFMILDFLEPWKFQNGAYGASGYGRPLTMDEISNTAKQFILGYEMVANRRLFLALGTSNNGPYVSEAHAQAWAKMLVDINEWIGNEGFHVRISSANDAELEYNSPQTTQAWFRALNNELSRSNQAIFSYDYGDASGCPKTPATSTPQPCNSSSQWPWTQKDIADLLTLAIPQVYNNSMSLQWAQISAYIDLRSGQNGALISGVISEQQACMQRGGCAGIDYSPDDAWSHMVGALNRNTITSSGVQKLMWSTDIKHNQ
jgi:hypothetical protein